MLLKLLKRVKIKNKSFSVSFLIKLCFLWIDLFNFLLKTSILLIVCLIQRFENGY